MNIPFHLLPLKSSIPKDQLQKVLDHANSHELEDSLRIMVGFMLIFAKHHPDIHVNRKFRDNMSIVDWTRKYFDFLTHKPTEVSS